MENKEKQSAVLIEVDDFIKHLDSGDWVLTPKAREIKLSFSGGKTSLGKTIMKEANLAEAIAHDIAGYQVLKDCIHRARNFEKPDPLIEVGLNSRMLDMAYAILGHIKRARVYGVIGDRNLTNKLDDYEKQNQRLKEKVDKLQKENEKLHETLRKFGKAGFVSDVKDASEE